MCQHWQCSGPWSPEEKMYIYFYRGCPHGWHPRRLHAGGRRKRESTTMLEDKERLVRELSPLGDARARQCTREAQERKEKLMCKEARDLAWRRKPLWNRPELGSPCIFGGGGGGDWDHTLCIALVLPNQSPWLLGTILDGSPLRHRIPAS